MYITIPINFTGNRFSRIPVFVHPCTCPKGCVFEDKAHCKMDRVTRNSCKLCRYTKCRSAGMIVEWVISAHIPRVEKPKSTQKKKRSYKNTKDYHHTDQQIECIVDEVSVEETISNMKQMYSQAFVVDMKVLKYI